MPFAKKKKKKQEEKPLFSVVKKERVPYREMSFWKANPDFKAHDATPYAIKQDFFDALIAFATNPETRPTEEMMIDDLD
jgi:hypothetical protein